MALQTPNLDDRKFQDIVSEARSKIPLYCPKWTDYNLSDPGITLIELFAWMVDMLLYRINKVPEKNYIKFMELLGVHLEPPQPARADITFRLSAPQPETVTIPKGTEVATLRTETQEAISFTTNEDLSIIVPYLAYALTTHGGTAFEDCMISFKSHNKPVTVFKTVPEENDAIYFGFDNHLSTQTLMLTIDSSIEGIGVDPNDPPLIWEYWNGTQEIWAALKLDSDTTGGLNTFGNVILYIPADAAIKEVNGERAFWIRCRATKPRPGQRPYSSSPKMKNISAVCIGGTVTASHCMRVAREVLGRSNGSPGQTYYLQYFPVLPREITETVDVETEKEGQFESWLEVHDFADSQPDDRHYTLDSVTGEIQFGPLIRQPSGEERRYGRTPPSGRQIRFTTYRWGGGIIGNVGKGTINVMKSSIPYVSSVTNFLAAVGGTDAETLEAAMIRAPRILRNQTRAVTADDFEVLALEASPQVARAKCLASGSQSDSGAIPPGVVRLLLVPRVEDVDRPIPRDQLELLSSVRSAVQEYLDERRLLAMRVEITAPEYLQISVETEVRVRPDRDFDEVTKGVKSNLYRYINPVCGGPRGKGWPFGRGLFPSEVSSVIQSTADVDYIENTRIFLVDWETGQRTPVESKITLPANGLICSAEHRVTAVAVEGYE